MTWTGKNEVLDEVIGRAELERMLDEAGATYTSRRIPAGAMVFWSGEPDGNHYYVESGSVELYGVDAAGRKKVIDRYGAGMFFGFHILRDTNLTMSTAQCLEDSRILTIPKESFFKLLRGGSDFSEYCVRYLFGLLSMQTNEMLNQSFYVTAQRVPMLLAKLAAERLAEDAGAANGGASLQQQRHRRHARREPQLGHLGRLALAGPGGHREAAQCHSHHRCATPRRDCPARAGVADYGPATCPTVFRRLPRLRLQQYLHDADPLFRGGRGRDVGGSGASEQRVSGRGSPLALRLRPGGGSVGHEAGHARGPCVVCARGHSVPAVCRVLADAFGALRAGGRPCFFLVVAGHGRRFGGGCRPRRGAAGSALYLGTPDDRRPRCF